VRQGKRYRPLGPRRRALYLLLNSGCHAGYRSSLELLDLMGDLMEEGRGRIFDSVVRRASLSAPFFTPPRRLPSTCRGRTTKSYAKVWDTSRTTPARGIRAKNYLTEEAQVIALPTVHYAFIGTLGEQTSFGGWKETFLVDSKQCSLQPASWCSRVGSRSAERTSQTREMIKPQWQCRPVRKACHGRFPAPPATMRAWKLYIVNPYSVLVLKAYRLVCVGKGHMKNSFFRNFSGQLDLPKEPFRRDYILYARRYQSRI
jgi:hypothetical protein